MGKRKSSCRKVQAQRKFAQGAFIPPNISNIPERPQRVLDSASQEHHVYQSNMKISTLLDVVTFRKLHPHANPVVWLNRLDLETLVDEEGMDISVPPFEEHKSERRTLRMIDSSPSTTLEESPTKSSPIKSSPIKASPQSSPRIKMATRKRKSTEIGASKVTRKHRSIAMSASPSKRRSNTDDSNMLNEDTDDDRPLKYYIKKGMTGPINMINRPRVVTRSSRGLLKFKKTRATLRLLKKRSTIVSSVTNAVRREDRLSIRRRSLKQHPKRQDNGANKVTQNHISLRSRPQYSNESTKQKVSEQQTQNNISLRSRPAEVNKCTKTQDDSAPYPKRKSLRSRSSDSYGVSNDRGASSTKSHSQTGKPTRWSSRITPKKQISDKNVGVKKRVATVVKTAKKLKPKHRKTSILTNEDVSDTKESTANSSAELSVNVSVPTESSSIESKKEIPLSPPSQHMVQPKPNKAETSPKVTFISSPVLKHEPILPLNASTLPTLPKVAKNTPSTSGQSLSSLPLSNTNSDIQSPPKIPCVPLIQVPSQPSSSSNICLKECLPSSSRQSTNQEGDDSRKGLQSYDTQRKNFQGYDIQSWLNAMPHMTSMSDEDEIDTFKAPKKPKRTKLPPTRESRNDRIRNANETRVLCKEEVENKIEPALASVCDATNMISQSNLEPTNGVRSAEIQNKDTTKELINSEDTKPSGHCDLKPREEKSQQIRAPKSNVYDFDVENDDTEPNPTLSMYRRGTRASIETSENLHLHSHNTPTIYLDPRLSSIPNHVIEIGMSKKTEMSEWKARLVPLSKVNRSSISMIYDDSLFDNMNSNSQASNCEREENFNLQVDQPLLKENDKSESIKTSDIQDNRNKVEQKTAQSEIKSDRVIPCTTEQHSKAQNKNNLDVNTLNLDTLKVQLNAYDSPVVVKVPEVKDCTKKIPDSVKLPEALSGLTQMLKPKVQTVSIPKLPVLSKSSAQSVDTNSLSRLNACVSEHHKKSDNFKFYLDPKFTSSQESQIIEITMSKASDGAHVHARLVSASQINEDTPMIRDQTSYDQMLNNHIGNRKVQEIKPTIVQTDKNNEQRPNSRTSQSSTTQSTQSVNSSSSCRRSGSQRSNNRPLAYNRTPTKAKIVDAPVFYPTEEEFKDPIEYFEIVKPMLKKFGLGKVVTPAGFAPTCLLDDQMRFNVINQYIARMYARWGPISREMCTIRAHLATQGVVFTRAPLLDGIEVNLSKLYHVVQRHGGLRDVIQRKRWSKVAEEMGLPKGPKLEKKLDQIYLKYLVPYDTLSSKERQQIMAAVEQCWSKKYKRMIDRALNPLHRQRRLVGESDSSDEDDDEETSMLEGALQEAEDCVVPGRNMNLATFKKIAEKVMHMRWPNSTPSTERIETEYWNVMLMGSDHECVYSASVDTKQGYGFANSDLDPQGKHPWNLKMLSHDKGNVLRFLDSVPGVSTLHLGMMHSTSCLHRDPHGLPFTEYLHEGPPKIWYGIPEDQSENFRKAVETLCPSYCQNKEVWLPSDIAMIPPNQLIERNVALTRVEQKPGEFVLVYPQAYSCSICTGYTVSESAYFATKHWLDNAYLIFQNLRESCEPTMFPLEQILLSAGRDVSVSLEVLHRVYTPFRTIVKEELRQRRALERIGVPSQTHRPQKGDKRRTQAVSPREQHECEICRATLYLSHVTGVTDKTSAMCVQHALRVLSSPKYKGRSMSSINLTCFYSAAELENVLMDIDRRLGKVENISVANDKSTKTSQPLKLDGTS